MFDCSALWEDELITNERLVSNQGRSFFVVLFRDLETYLHLHSK